jgi:hypothetical protein
MRKCVANHEGSNPDFFLDSSFILKIEIVTVVDFCFQITGYSLGGTIPKCGILIEQCNRKE